MIETANKDRSSKFCPLAKRRSDSKYASFCCTEQWLICHIFCLVALSKLWTLYFCIPPMQTYISTFSHFSFRSIICTNTMNARIINFVVVKKSSTEQEELTKTVYMDSCRIYHHNIVNKIKHYILHITHHIVSHFIRYVVTVKHTKRRHTTRKI